MKKLIFSIMCAMVATISAVAGSPFKVVDGQLPSLQDKKVFVEYDEKDMMILDEDTKKTMTIEQFCQMKGEDWVRDIHKDDFDAHTAFEKVLFKKAKFTLVNEKSDADYILVCKPTTFSYGNPHVAVTAFMSNDVFGFFIGEFYIKTPAGATVAKIDCKKIHPSSSGGWSFTAQKCGVYEKVAKELVSFLKK